MTNKLKLFLLAAVMAPAMIVPQIAEAQMNNRPYAFRNGGVGMSPGGRQAILNEKIFDVTPDNLMRGPDGTLLDVTEGPGHSALVSREGNGGFITSYRGADFRGGDASMQVGVFNSFFVPVYRDDSYATYSDYQTSAVMNAWMSSVSPQVYYDSGNSVSSWTGFVHTLGRQ